ncbi:MAG: type II toxin-antitoxin system VapB family antitoxin [Candidatus Omnitrophica bacterium]|nr:type II toxin-antitoxin system VapB family antitoxin [Candidatus Omnitrophota bacterium]
MRTNINIDDELLLKAKKISQVKTKREIVEKALKEFVINHSRLNIADLKGHIDFDPEYNYKKLRKG